MGLARLLVFALAAWCACAQPGMSPFLVAPYLQLGDSPADAERLELLWHARDTDDAWSVRYRAERGEGAWRTVAVPAQRRVDVPTIEPHRVYQATLTGLKPGAEFEYEVRHGDAPVFSATGRARKSAGQPYRFVVFGDCAADTVGQRAVAHQTWLQKPDFVFVTGDIVYARGRISEYRQKFFPVYNAEQPGEKTGAPLIRSTLFTASPGNHDILTTDLDAFPDGLAYFFYWSQPLNGPTEQTEKLNAANTPALKGNMDRQAAFLTAAGAQYPRMSNFSFEYGNAHWTVLDANPYVDWTNPELREWLRQDLKRAQGATWRFVGFHQPGFNSSKAHFSEQQMRLVADLFEEGGVDVVFTGHVHNYQRSYPMRFAVKRDAEGKPVRERNRVEGTWTLDRAYDSTAKTRPQAPIYLVTGAGGAGLYNPEQQGAPETWQEFTLKFVSDRHSLTVADVDGRTITVRQVGADGGEIDRFVLTK